LLVLQLGRVTCFKQWVGLEYFHCDFLSVHNLI